MDRTFEGRGSGLDLRSTDARQDAVPLAVGSLGEGEDLRGDSFGARGSVS